MRTYKIVAVTMGMMLTLMILILAIPLKLNETSNGNNNHENINQYFKKHIAKLSVQNNLFVAELAIENGNTREAKRLIAEAEEMMKTHDLKNQKLTNQITQLKEQIKKKQTRK